MTATKPLTLEEREALMDSNPPEVDTLHAADLYFDWSWRGCGWGQLSISYDRQTGELTAMNECMDRDSVRKFLHALADFIADRVVLEASPNGIVAPPPIDSKAELEQRRQDAKRTVRRIGKRVDNEVTDNNEDLQA